ncbi:MAG: DUF3072 domain-containing protein [Xanthobacteraceae bacterium]|jgi:hypothetical protein
MTDNRRMTPEQAATLRRLAEAAYELGAFKSNLTRAEADNRIAALRAKLKQLDAIVIAERSGHEHVRSSCLSSSCLSYRPAYW